MIFGLKLFEAFADMVGGMVDLGAIPRCQPTRSRSVRQDSLDMCRLEIFPNSLTVSDKFHYT
jgi:hypothetical protein